MRLQTLKLRAGSEPEILAETPWHDDSSLGGTYRDRLKQYLGGYFERDENSMQPKTATQSDQDMTTPDVVRVLGDDGQVLETYAVEDLVRDTGLDIR